MHESLPNRCGNDLDGVFRLLAGYAGSVATGNSREEVQREMRDAIEFHIEGLREEGFSIPMPVTTADYVDVVVAA